MHDSGPQKTALLLIAHGSRRAEANADLDYVADALRRRGPFSIVESCYLELAEPNIAAGAARCMEQGSERVVMLPYFLSAGIHVREDLEQMRQELQVRYGVPFILAEPLGRHPLLVEIVLQRAREADAASK
ncbi:MAG: CbiX/SirB N-terminal domain-containing protein [Gemmatales bacterium]|nr:CbiX/SirB N-terminal domain-containing protein [Gemmatales bacterium]MDW8387471.1 CbiX/SirB N-terminal domain-containing protein [Gemmatales bacterium]